MKQSVTVAMQNYLAGGSYQLATMLLIYLKNGDNIAITDWQTSITYGGVTYSSLFETYARSNIRSDAGMSTQSVEATGLTGQAGVTANGINEADVQAGFFDGATFILFQMVPTDTNAATYGIIKLRAGRLGVVTNELGQYTLSLDGWATMLQQTFTNTFDIACNADLFDSRCTLSATPYSYTGEVTAVATGANEPLEFSALLSNGQAVATGLFNFGVLTWSSGENAGLAMEVRSWTNFSGGTPGPTGAIVLFLPMGYPISAGDVFVVQYGCDKSLKTCINTFANGINHRGFPYIPGLDTYFYANAALQFPTGAS